MSAFDLMLDAMFADPSMAVDAVYTPPGGGAPQPCRALTAMGDEASELGRTGAVAPARIVEIRKSELPLIVKKGTLAIAAGSPFDGGWPIAQATQSDQDRRLWRVELG